MNEYPTLEAIAGELRDLQCRRKELGVAALEAIRHADEELVRLLLEGFGSDDVQAGMWLAQPSLLMDTTPIEQLAAGRRANVVRALVGIVHGSGA